MVTEKMQRDVENMTHPRNYGKGLRFFVIVVHNQFSTYFYQSSSKTRKHVVLNEILWNNSIFHTLLQLRSMQSWQYFWRLQLTRNLPFSRRIWPHFLLPETCSSILDNNMMRKYKHNMDIGLINIKHENGDRMALVPSPPLLPHVPS